MEITGIICEYNPFHNGHKKQIDMIRKLQGENSGIVCLMSGNFVQRGAPAIIDKSLRAKAAVICGADLVLELPVTYALRSAEGFAQGGVNILSGFCTHLCFGTESGNIESLTKTAEALLCADFSEVLRVYLSKGLSFPAARQSALEQLRLDSSLLTTPNNILAVEYCKAILSSKSPMKPLPIIRNGNYHDTVPNVDNPSATAIREIMESAAPWQAYIPDEASKCFHSATIHSLMFGERAILSKLRTMSDEEFAAIPFGSEGLWRKLMHAARSESTLNNILSATKSKRYTRTRLDRMIMCAFLGITEEDLHAQAPYVRVLALNNKGREILNRARNSGSFPNIGEKQEHPYQQLENRCGNLYGLFANGASEPPSSEAKQRIFYLND